MIAVWWTLLGCAEEPPATCAEPVDLGIAASDLSASYSRICILDDAGLAQCWSGDEDDPVVDLVPDTPYAAIATGSVFACGLDAEGQAECWGEWEGQGLAVLTFPGPFASIVAGDYYACGLSAQGAASCWGWKFVAEYGDISPDLVLSDLAAGWAGTCGIEADSGEILCWGLFDSPPPEGAYVDVDVAASYNGACAVAQSGELSCWDSDYLDEPPPGVFVEVSVASAWACARQSDGHVECWGDTLPRPPLPTCDPVDQLSAGGGFVCGRLSADGEVVCWGPAPLPEP